MNSATVAPLPTVDLVALDGTSTTLQAHLAGRPTVVLAMRYYGCLPCQHYLVGLHEARQQFTDAGVDLLTVGVATDYQAEYLRETYGIDHTMLLDPDQNLYRALELRQIKLRDWLFPRTWIKYVPIFWKRYVTRTIGGPKQGRVLVGGSTQTPGIALLDAGGALSWIYRGQGLGDYPDLSVVLDKAREVARPAA